MAQFFSIHPENPQPRLIRQACGYLRDGQLVALPTDSSYALVCHVNDKQAADALRRLRGVDERHHLTLLCRDLSELGTYARADNQVYRLLKMATPGPYTFILEATREVPRRVSHPSRKTIGIRVPEHAIVQAVLEELGEPALSTTLIPAGEDEPLNDAEEIRRRYEHQLALVIDGGACSMQPTTVVDLTGEAPAVVRVGRGDPALFV